MPGPFILGIVVGCIRGGDLLHDPVQAVVDLQEQMEMILHEAESDDAELLFLLILLQRSQEEQIVCLFLKQNLLADAAGDNMIIAGGALYSCCSGHDSHPLLFSICGYTSELKANKKLSAKSLLIG